MLLAQGGCATILDFARHEVGFLASIWEWRIDCTYIFWDGSGTHSDPRIRRVEWAAVIVQGVSNCLGQTLECWKRHSERSLKPAGGWMGRAELMACVREATWYTSQTTRSSIKGRIGVGPHRDLGKVAIPISGGECPEA